MARLRKAVMHGRQHWMGGAVLELPTRDDAIAWAARIAAT
jgi:hypothetical protein